MTAVADVRSDVVTSADGTPLGCLSVGDGPTTVVVLHGAMQTAADQVDLACALAGDVRVVLPDRRGRGRSGARPARRDAAETVRQDVEDVAAVVAATGATALLGVSSGALVALAALDAVPAVDRVVAFEPPLMPDAERVSGLLARLETELAQGRPHAALTTGWLAIELGPAAVRKLPRPVLETLVRLGSWAQARRATDLTRTMRALAATLPDDFRVVLDAARRPDRWAVVRTPVLLVGTERSPRYLAAALDVLEDALPRAERVTLPGVGHEATGNADQRGRPALVADAVRAFLAEGLSEG